ncbi:DUF6069 family protein [Nocardia sp. CDC159]|uniref:DUF6069 family protein n=1 Tax=Nocardia pulmonis TaxID=2951408 RepID=A0A9X2E409_9NOCA|nr:MULTISPECIES: DUF6069 family protein [Nocardia]MCM6773892.1 DUF6069 family protein [Nocardia pulmonis]MCM6786779.1 DUF6069 family protein [Nocardia sp. CDC159]
MSTLTATSRAVTWIPAIRRPVAVFGGVAAAVLANLVLWLIGEVAGGSFQTVDANGAPMDVAPGGVVVLSTVPLFVGLTAAVALSYLWTGVLRVAAGVGSVLSLGTIAITLAAGFDTPSTITLSLMHVTLVPVLIVALEGVRRSIVR